MHASRVLPLALAAVLIGACTGGGSDSDPAPSVVDSLVAAAPSTEASSPETSTTIEAVDDGYRASITRTEHGVAHIVADDWGSLGFGQGYAFSEDRACTLIDQVIKVRGERSKWFGPGENGENLDTDFAYRHLGLHDTADERFGDQPETISAMVDGYVAGFNTALAAAEANNGPAGWCAAEEWVQPITTTDLYAYLNDVMLLASSGVLISPIATAAPPADTPAPAGDELAVTTTLGSNGWGIGGSISDSGGGLLLANPHFPWEGEKRLWENHLTLTTGELDVYGVTLSGVPGVLIGFNRDVAWTHTVSAGHRMTLYQLDLVPGDPTSYLYGSETRPMTATEISIEVLQDDGSSTTETRTMYASHYGPMLNLPFGWSTEKAYTMRDANIDNADSLEQFFGMNQATSLDEFIEAHRVHNGIPWVNTIATSAQGTTWYADTAATPNLAPEAITGWQAEVAAGGLAATVLDNGAILLNGSDPLNEWVDDPAATRPGILPFDAQPQLLRDDYVFNANDSHWLANPEELLTGYSPMTGAEQIPQSERTRMNAILLADQELRGADGQWSLAELQAAFTSDRALHSELLLKDAVAACERSPQVPLDGAAFDLGPACDVLRQWDGSYQVDSVGAALWREFVYLFGSDGRRDAGTLYRVAFDPADPVGTPNSLAVGTPAEDEAVLVNLARAAQGMAAAGFAIDAPLGDLQFDGRVGDERVPVPGGTNSDGAISIVDCCSGALTLAPRGDPGTFSEVHSFSDKGYPITFGNSFVLTLQFGPQGPVAESVLTYGQPDDETDPGFRSQTELYGSGAFKQVLFDAEAVAAGAVATTEVSGPRP